MKRFLPALTLVALLTACVSTRATLVNPSAAPFPKVAPAEVIIFTSAEELDTLNYQRVAIIEASGSGEWTNQSQMLEAMRKKAGDLGANAVLLPQIKEPGAGAKVAAAVFGTGTQRKGNAVALRILGRK